MEICPYCGIRNPITDAAPAAGVPIRCHECGGVLDDLSMTATQIAMGPWFFRQPNKPYGPGCDISILRKLIGAGRIKPDSAVRGPGSHQLWRKVKHIPGIAHLAGVCYSCGVNVKPDSKFCQDCGTKFVVPTQRNEWGLPTGPVSELVAEYRKTDGTMCVVCGHGKTGADECPECESIFAPADEATRITLGGWFVHGKAEAFKPGISYEQLRKEVEIGKVTGRTILRGPTTEQFWKLAKNTQGVAHLLGSCHSCGEKVAASAESCPACKASFAVPSDPDWVGLRYPTADSAAAAQAKLDEELAAIAATMPAVAPVKNKRKAEEAELVAELAEDEDVELEGVAPQGEEDEGEAVYAEEDAAAPAFELHQHEEDQHEQLAAVAAVPGDGGGFDLHPADQAAAASGRERRAATQYKKSQTTLIAWLIVTPVVLIGAYFAISALSSNVKPSGEKDADKKVAKKDGSAQKAEASPQLMKLKSDTEARLAQFKSVERKGKPAPFLAQAEATLAKANELYNSEQFLEANAEYLKVETPLAEVEKIRQQHAQATETRGRAQNAQNEAKALIAPQHAKELWDAAEASFAQGAKLLAEENYDQAIVAWTSAAEQYGKASRLVQVMLTAADVRAKIEADATKTFTRADLDKENIPAWNAVKGKLKAGDDAIAEKKFEEGMQFYDQARLMVPSLDFAMKLQIGRSFYAYQAGRLTARILIAKAATYHPDEEMLALLKASYENLQINRDFFNRIPISKNCTYKELAEIMVIECGKEIETTFEEAGPALKSSFAVGMHMFIIEKQLRADVGKLTTKTREDIDLYIRRILPDAAKAAGYAPQFMEFIKDFEGTLATETNLPTKSREKWAAMLEKLDKFETAMEIVSPRK